MFTRHHDVPAPSPLSLAIPNGVASVFEYIAPYYTEVARFADVTNATAAATWLGYQHPVRRFMVFDKTSEAIVRQSVPM